MKYKIGQLYFWNSNEDLFGKAITYYNNKVFGESDCTHVGIIVDVNEAEVTIMEATGRGFEGSNYSIDWLENKRKLGFVHIGEVKQKMNDVELNASKYLDIGYGWLDIISIAFSFLTGFKVGLTGKNKLICSEAVSRIIYDCTKSVDIASEYGIPYDEVTPMHIFKSKKVEIL